MVGMAKQFRVLSQRRRLVALTVLRERDSWMSVDELATEVGVRELGVRRAELTDEQRERILVSFHHVHFPKLNEAGLAEFASDDRVRFADVSADVHRILDAVFDE